MSKSLKVIVFLNACIIVISFALYLLVYKSVDGLQDSINKESKIFFPNSKDTIFVNASAWGLTGDHIEIVISHLPIFNRGSSRESDYIYYDPTIYYKKENDTLVVYTLSPATIPNNFNTRVKVKQIQIEDPEEWKEYAHSYSSSGLTKVSVYD